MERADVVQVQVDFQYPIWQEVMKSSDSRFRVFSETANTVSNLGTPSTVNILIFQFCGEGFVFT